MTNDGHSGSRWEPEHRRDETAELPAATQPTAQPRGPPARKRPLAALTAAGLVLIGGAGGFAIATASASTDTPAFEQGGTGTQDGVPVPPGGGQLPDSDGDGTPDVGGRGGMPDLDGDDGSAPPDGQDGTRSDGATDDPADDAGDPV